MATAAEDAHLEALRLESRLVAAINERILELGGEMIPPLSHLLRQVRSDWGMSESRETPAADEQPTEDAL